VDSHPKELRVDSRHTTKEPINDDDDDVDDDDETITGMLKGRMILTRPLYTTGCAITSMTSSGLVKSSVT